MKEDDSQTMNPALQELEIFVGDWEMVLSNASFLPDPSATMRGKVAWEWVEGGAFLVMYMGKNPSDAVWLVGRDESKPNFLVFYYDARKVSRVYEMSFSDGMWKMWRNSPGFSQRFEGKLSQDGKTIKAYWEKSADGSTWEHDFDVTYSKIK